MITGKTKLLGVIGYPIEHTLSPTMHNAAIAQMGLDYVYLPLPVPPDRLDAAIAGFAAVGVVGFSVTIPHKQAILPFLSEITPEARAVGAVNTVWRTEQGWKGTNTDVSGFISPLRAYDNWSDRAAVVLGNGGAARAVVAGLTQLGCRELHVVGRTPEKLEAFARSWEKSTLDVQFETHDWDELPNLMSAANLLVNTTPVGMSPQVDRSPVEPELFDKLPPNSIAYDLIYTPNPTQFLKFAWERGATAINGLEMLVRQGAIALEIWTGQEVPVEVMRQRLQQHLGLDR
ncbi:shikimate dehydrogenase [Leptolyngbya valderiana BDU 20041]|nr:shikimate dehydrogenase [Geitlerinema sp. CS-897]OAB59985.1 shikimate dehydrogenase [Leptolyngbya valderiana BDU 20041]PPT08385.1 Shikimate 5-dehydrogenase I alpha [Geitlerinema sp. FC II]